MAVVLAAYPAGIGVSGLVPGAGRWSIAGLALFAGAAISASAAAFVLANWVAPAVLPPDPATGAPLVQSLTLGAMTDSLGVLGQALPTGPATAEAWRPYNHLAYHYVRRTDGMVLPALFAWVGLLAGHGSAVIRVAPLRRLVRWSLGAFLLVSTYLAGENGYEMVALRSAGHAEFAADFVLIVPGTLIVGLGLAAVSRAARGKGDPA
jgi:hypothetical protein